MIQRVERVVFTKTISARGLYKRMDGATDQTLYALLILDGAQEKDKRQRCTRRKNVTVNK